MTRTKPGYVPDFLDPVRSFTAVSLLATGTLALVASNDTPAQSLIDVVHVPCKSSGPAYTDLVAGRF